MKMMIINGSPRKGGYTSELIHLFREGANESGAVTSVVELRKSKITPCIGCFKCWVGDTSGRCIFSDDMEGIIDEYLQTDVLVIATPMYYYSFSSLLKIFLERLFPTTQPGLELDGALGLARNRPRLPGKGPKRCALITTCALRNPATMNPLVATFELVCDAIAAKPAGMLLRTESSLLDFEYRKPRTLRKVLAAFRKAGEELATTGVITPETAAAAATPLSSNEETFAIHFENYWAVANEIGPQWTNRKILAEQVAADPRIVMRELAGFLDPDVARDLTATIEFVIRDASPEVWHLRIEGGRCTAHPEASPNPDATMEMSSRAFSELALGRVNTRVLLSKGVIKAHGDTRLLARFSRLFPRPND